MADPEASRRIRDPRIQPRHWMLMAACAVIYENGKLLIVRDQQGFWSGAGGWIEVGESPEEAVVREVREELGVESEVFAIFRPFIDWNVAVDQSPINFLLFPRAVRLLSTNLKPDPVEITDVAWVDPADLESYDRTPQVRLIYDLYLEDWLSAFEA
jgi:8-oxo-dGTP diphosphatase